MNIDAFVHDWHADWIAPVEGDDLPARRRLVHQLAGGFRLDGAVARADLAVRLNDWLGGEDSNPQRLDQNQLCYRLHHPRTGGPQPYRTVWRDRTPGSGARSLTR
jgi:hypothetical protein